MSPSEIGEDVAQQYKDLGLSRDCLSSLNEKLKVPRERLSALARPRRREALYEALEWEKGPDQENRKITELHSLNEYTVAVAKPGKEAAPNYIGCRNYMTGEKTNNPNDMLPLILKLGRKVGEDMTFEDTFDAIDKSKHEDMFGLDLMGSLLFRMAFMLDHEKNEEGNWRFRPPQEVIEMLEKRIPTVRDVPTRVFLHFLDVLSLNEDVKVHTLGYSDLPQDYGRINTLLTFTHLTAVSLNRRSLAKFAGSFARPPSGMAPLPKTKATEYFPLLSPDWSQTILQMEYSA